MNVERIMSHQLTTCSPGDTLEDAANLMWDGDYGCLPVTTEVGGRIAGIITDRDICMAALFKGKPLREVRVADVMARTVLTCRATDDIEGVQRQMQYEQVRRVPVVNADGAVIGIVSMADLVCESARSQYMQRHEVPASDVMVTLAKISTPAVETVP